ncbi:MAG: outer membrane lipoprotein carrier protein LolA [Deltaproteobacteria bacterium]|nr:outer membrane lipoprotein carrier protein LolA [Deltaproteobacteria bacterium]
MPRYILAVLALFLTAWLWSWGTVSAPAAPSGQAILDGLSKRYQGLESLSASYSRRTQTSLSEGVFQNQASHLAAGRLTWQKPASLKLDQTEPGPELLVTDGQTVWWYLPGEKQVHIYRRLDLAGEMAPLLSFLTSLAELKKSFRIRTAPQDGSRPGQWGLILEPRQKDSASGQIAAWCDENFQLTGFDLVSITGEKTAFYLTGLSTALPDGREFVFQVPRGVKVIEETDQ